MSSGQIVRSVFVAAGIAILVLLIVPAVHLPFVVVHGPMTALRAQRAAWLLNFLLSTVAFLFLGFVFPMFSFCAISKLNLASATVSDQFPLRSPLRC
jgi:hypothetical protein